MSSLKTSVLFKQTSVMITGLKFSLHLTMKIVTLCVYLKYKESTVKNTQAQFLKFYNKNSSVLKRMKLGCQDVER